ncbi:HD-GYP domain-containing protein [Bradyrhizobium sp.]|uniref:HD-GYP domain-containing protein n=1 Tax=Bradyrhizobium sp. TaxID=376 RepID=UPI003C4A6BE9
MIPLSVVIDRSSSPNAIRTQLGTVFAVEFRGLDQIEEIEPQDDVVFDIDVLRCPDIPRIKQWLAKPCKRGKTIFAVDKASRHAQAQAAAFGASGVVNRPLAGREVMTTLLGDFDGLTDNETPPQLRSFADVAPALDALENIFLSAHLGAALDLQMVDFASRTLIRSIADSGVEPWIDIVRKHHSQTYQHSLLVTGIVTAFARELGMSEADQARLASAALLHDIGKARIPVPILEKPGALDAEEMLVLRQHARYGHEALASVPGLDKDLLDMVVHHHEYLDGTGYPDHLRAARISDLVRLVTISDVFGALIERRSYKKPMSCKQAYYVLLTMGQKLDEDMRREFKFVSELRVG